VLKFIKKNIKFIFGIILGISMAFLFGTMDGADAGVVPELPMEIYLGWGILTSLGMISLMKWNDAKNEASYWQLEHRRLAMHHEKTLIELYRQKEPKNKKVYNREKE
jgi:hypothetical protein